MGDRSYLVLPVSLCLIALLLVSCDTADIIPEPEALVSILRWEQPYYEFWGGWSDLVEVWYEIANTGRVDIQYYKIWFVAMCEDGGEYEGWTNGLGLDKGHTMSDSMFITVPKKKVKSVRVVEWRLATY